MAIAFVVGTSWGGNGSDPSSGINTTGGTLAVMVVTPYIDAGTNQVPVPVDSKGNTWTLAVAVPSSVPDPASHNIAQYIFYSMLTSVGTGHTFSSVPGNSTYVSNEVIVFSGTAATGVLDQISAGFSHITTTSPSTFQGGSLTPSVAGCVVISTQGNFGNTGTGTTLTVGSGFTLDESMVAVFAANTGSGVAHLIQTTATAENPTWTLASTTNQFDLLGINLSFKPAVTVLTGSQTDTSTTSDSLTAHLVVAASLSDTSTTSESLTAHMLVAASLSDTSTTSDALIAIVAAALSDASVTSDALTSIVQAALSDTSATSDTVTAVMRIAVALSDSVTASDSEIAGSPATYTAALSDHLATYEYLVAFNSGNVQVPPTQDSDILNYVNSIIPIMSQGAAAFTQAQLARLLSKLPEMILMLPQTATEVPKQLRDGMIRLARNPWYPVSGQAADAWVYFDAAGQVWRYLRQTDPTSIT